MIGSSLPQAAEAPHVDDVAHRVHHAAGAEEQQGLEEGVREQVEHRRDHGHAASRRVAGAQRQEHVAELADRRVGQHALEVGLRQGDQRGEQGGEAADAGDHELGRRGDATNSGVQRATR